MGGGKGVEHEVADARVALQKAEGFEEVMFYERGTVGTGIGKGKGEWESDRRRGVGQLHGCIGEGERGEGCRSQGNCGVESVGRRECRGGRNGARRRG